MRSLRKLSRRQLIISLIFPVGITFWALGYYVLWAVAFGITPKTPVQWGYLAAVVLCGVLPAILTVTLGIDTGQYMIPRIIISVCASAFTSMALEFLADNSETAGVFFMIVFTVFSALYFYKIRPTKFSEWIIIFLSNPCLVRLIVYFAQSLTFQRYFEGALWSTQ